MGSGGGADPISAMIGMVLNSYNARQQANVAEAQHRVSLMQAKDALERGREAQRDVRREANRVVEAQRAGHAAQGMGLTSGTPVDLAVDTTRVAEADAARVRSNAAREAWGYKTEASLYRYQEKQLRDQGRYFGLKSLWKAGNLFPNG